MSNTGPAHLSYSQLSSFINCGEQYRLEKVHQVPSRPSWAGVGGSAVHAATEAVDLILLGQGVTLDPDDFGAYLEEAIVVAEERSGYSREDFRASGRASKAWPDKENLAWWQENGPLMVERWKTWRQVNRWEILLLDGDRPAIELEVNAPFGDELVKAYIDRVMVNPDGEMAVVDLKSGSRMPIGSMQLGQYAESFARVSGYPRPTYGFYWNARTGSTTEVFNLDVWSADYFEYAYAGIAERKRTGDLYLPHITNTCNSCGVRDYCRYVGGEKADEVPPPWKDRPTQKEKEQ